MKGPRTIFGPFVLIAMVALGFALGRVERATNPPERPDLTAEAQPAAEATPTFRVADVLKALSPQAPAPLLIIPVQGVDTDALVDTWGAARSEGRRHQGIDIMAPEGTPVRAAVDGTIVKFFDSQRGGVTIYQEDAAGQVIYYYAHLRERNAGLREGDTVRQGAVIGYVGQTGNATTPHLHFEIQRRGTQAGWWRGEAVNPYPFLMTGQTPD